MGALEPRDPARLLDMAQDALLPRAERRPALTPAARTTCWSSRILPGHAYVRNIVTPLAQRRKPDHVAAEPIEEIFPERARGHHLPEVAVGRRDDPHIDRAQVAAAEPPDLAVLDRA